MTTPTQEKEFPSDEEFKLPRPFILRRLHSLLGLWLVIYLFEHLLVNSQMALYFENHGTAFIAMVNRIHDLPYLKAIEILFLGIPFLIHGVWGMYYAYTGKLNAHCTGGKKPSLPQYKRNRAYSWQRITSWLLVVGIVAHVIQMRFVDYPNTDGNFFTTQLEFDRGLPAVADKLGVQLKREENHVLAFAPTSGAAFYLIVRETFKSPLMVILYSLLVVAAGYHAFNGLWTFMISWGITLTRRSQKAMRKITSFLMALVILLGLMSAWGSYYTIQFMR